MIAWLLTVLVSIDQSLNAVLGPVLNYIANPLYLFGDADETLSSVLGKNMSNGSCRGCYIVCRLLNYFDPDHCVGAIEADEGAVKGRTHAPASNDNNKGEVT